MKKGHIIEIFAANCPLCKSILDNIEVGKCASCTMTIYDVTTITNQIRKKMKDYDINAVPTTIIDGKIKVVGITSFPWICDDKFYDRLRREYSFVKQT